MQAPNSQKIHSIIDIYMGIRVSNVIHIKHNNFLFIDFGKLFMDKLGFTRGENHLSVLNAWRLEQMDSFMVASNDDRDKPELFECVSLLIGKNLEKFSVAEPALDAAFEFSSGLKLSAFNLISQGDDIDREAWRFFYSDMILSIGPGIKVDISFNNNWPHLKC